MLNVTPSARARLLSKLERRSAAPGIAMRFTRRQNGWKLQQDQARKGDTLFTHEGRIVLMLDAAVSKAMARFTLDAGRTDRGIRLNLRRHARKSNR